MQRRVGFLSLLTIVLCGFFIVMCTIYILPYSYSAAYQLYETDDSMLVARLVYDFTTEARNSTTDGAYLPATIQNKLIVNPHNFKYILNPIGACNGDVEVVICVPVARDKTQARRVVAETWGSYAYNKTNKAVLLFFIGNATKNEPLFIQKTIEDEFNHNQDIVQEDYLDVYRNLSLKSMSILKWVGKFCHNARYVIKADADIFSNMELLVQNIRDTHSRLDKKIRNARPKPGSKTLDYSHFIMGYSMNGVIPVRKDSKWVSTRKEFPGDVYPNYVSGTCYSMPVNTAKYLFQIAIRTKLFWLEDVFITGIVASIGRVVRISNRYQHIDKIRPIRGCKFKMVASAHTYKLGQIETIYNELHDPNIKC